MYKFAIAFMTLFLAGCCCDPSYVPSYRRDNGAADAPVYRKTARRAAYTKYVAPKGDVIHAAGFDIQQGQQMRDFLMILKSRCMRAMSATIRSGGHIMSITNPMTAKSCATASSAIISRTACAR